MTETLRSVGLKPFAPTGAANGVYDGDFAVLNAQMALADRYRAYLAISCGQVRCVLGTRAAMYAPVEGNALFLILDDVCYQNADGMMPYANARGVLRLRAKSHNGVFVAMANARSAQSQWETDAAHVGDTQVSGFSTPIHALPAVTKEASPWIRWLNRDWHDSPIRPSAHACHTPRSGYCPKLWKPVRCCCPYRRTVSPKR